jgi:tetratricopeptide (TPR) repeat protein
LRFYIESLIMQGNWAEAEATLREKMAKHPNSSTYWVFLAGAYSCRDDYAKAVEYFARAVEINPGNVYASFPLAVALCKAGRRDEYQRVCHECLVRLGSPDPAAIPSGLVAMALLAPVGGADFDRACELAERLPIDDADVFGYWKLATKALAALRQSRFKSAKEWAQRAIAFRGSLPRCQAQAWFIDAAASAELHDLGAARVSLQRGDDLAEEHNSGLYLGVLRDRDSWVIAGILREQAAERIAEMDSAAAESTPDRHR